MVDIEFLGEGIRVLAVEVLVDNGGAVDDLVDLVHFFKDVLGDAIWGSNDDLVDILQCRVLASGCGVRGEGQIQGKRNESRKKKVSRG